MPLSLSPCMFAVIPTLYSFSYHSPHQSTNRSSLTAAISLYRNPPWSVVFFVCPLPDCRFDDEAANRYRGLRCGQLVHLIDSDQSGLLVKPDVALAQLEAERIDLPPEPEGQTRSGITPEERTTRTPDGTIIEKLPEARRPRRFHGAATLSPTRVGLEASSIADEVIVHLAGMVGANVTITLEIEADVSAGVPDHVVRTVTENARTLKFTTHGFEQE